MTSFIRSGKAHWSFFFLKQQYYCGIKDKVLTWANPLEVGLDTNVRHLQAHVPVLLSRGSEQAFVRFGLVDTKPMPLRVCPDILFRAQEWPFFTRATLIGRRYRPTIQPCSRNRTCTCTVCLNNSWFESALFCLFLSHYHREVYRAVTTEQKDYKRKGKLLSSEMLSKVILPHFANILWRRHFAFSLHIFCSVALLFCGEVFSV